MWPALIIRKSHQKRGGAHRPRPTIFNHPRRGYLTSSFFTITYHLTRKKTPNRVSFFVLALPIFPGRRPAKYVGSRMPRRCLRQMKASASERSVPLLQPPTGAAKRLTRRVASSLASAFSISSCICMGRVWEGRDLPSNYVNKANKTKRTTLSSGSFVDVGATYFPGPSPAKYRGQKRA